MKAFANGRPALFWISVGLNAAFFVVIIGAAAIGSSSPGRGGNGGGPWKRADFFRERFERMMEVVDLTEGQRERIEAIIDQGSQDMMTCVGGFHERRKEGVATLIRSPEDDALYAEQVRESIEDHERMMSLLHGNLRRVASVLTQEQREHLAERMLADEPPFPRGR